MNAGEQKSTAPTKSREEIKATVRNTLLKAHNTVGDLEKLPVTMGNAASIKKQTTDTLRDIIRAVWELTEDCGTSGEEAAFRLGFEAGMEEAEAQRILEENERD